ncbi:MAG: hypothetical protein JWM11_1531 [Planctomycetaceae bacterium]|nr:hypothetical protein [Planctomycetaceae bacterium]
MDFALLTTGHETLPLIQAIAGDSRHRLVAFVADDAVAADVSKLAPSARRFEVPAELLGLPGIQAVVVDSSDSEALEVAKQLAANSVAVLLIPRAEQGIEFIYQFGLIRDEQPGQFRLYPVRPLRLHPLVSRLRGILHSGELGHIHQLQWQREEPVAGKPDEPCLLTKNQIDQALLHDTDLLKVWAGEFDQITSIQTGDSDQGILQAAVSLGGQKALPSHWTCRGTSGVSTWQLTVVGHAGQVTLKGDRDPSRITWQSTLGGRAAPPEIVVFDWGTAVLQEFITGSAAGVAVTELWANDLCRSFDLLEGAHRSLRRKRTVDLYFDTPSERGNFKSTMTAVGCSLLMLTLLTILMGLGAGAVAKDLNLPPIVMQVVRILVFAPLFLFLLLQVGVFLAKPSGGRSS